MTRWNEALFGWLRGDRNMGDQSFDASDPTATQGSHRTGRSHTTAGDAFSKASDMARDAGARAKRAAADTASSMSDSVMGLLNEQLGSGAASAGRLADAMRVAANDLSRESPLLAGVVRTFAGNVDGYAGSLENQTVEQLAKTSDYTRRQPALVFGLAAVAGFFAFRTSRMPDPSRRRRSSQTIRPVRVEAGPCLSIRIHRCLKPFRESYPIWPT
jgi:hypothetical protein